MAIAFLLEWPAGTQGQYDAMIQELNLGGKVAPGGVFHVAGPMDGGGWRVVDVWESQEVFDTFLHEKLGPAMQNAGVQPPQVKAWPVHNTLR